MAIPLTVAIVALVCMIGLLIWLFVRSQAEIARLQGVILEQSVNYTEYVQKSAEKMTRDVPKMSEKMLDTLAKGIADVQRGTSDAMQALYGPVRLQEQAMSMEQDDLPTPWYGDPGAMDYRDPTDGLLVSDPVEYPEGGGNLIMEGDDEPFGIPGLKLDTGG